MSLGIYFVVTVKIYLLRGSIQYSRSFLMGMGRVKDHWQHHKYPHSDQCFKIFLSAYLAEVAHFEITPFYINISALVINSSEQNVFSDSAQTFRAAETESFSISHYDELLSTIFILYHKCHVHTFYLGLAPGNDKGCEFPLCNAPYVQYFRHISQKHFFFNTFY